MRHACRAAGLRIRTGLANADERIAWVYHVDHVLTEAENRQRAEPSTPRTTTSRASRFTKWSGRSNARCSRLCETTRPAQPNGWIQDAYRA